MPSETHFTEEFISCYRWDRMIPSTASHSNSTSPQTSWSSWTSSSLAASTLVRWDPRRQHRPLLQLPHYSFYWPLIGCPSTLLQKLFVPDVGQSETDPKSPSSSDPVTNGLSESASHVSMKGFTLLLRVQLYSSLQWPFRDKKCFCLNFDYEKRQNTPKTTT